VLLFIFAEKIAGLSFDELHSSDLLFNALMSKSNFTTIILKIFSLGTNSTLEGPQAGE
jgi:hypothetical protein